MRGWQTTFLGLRKMPHDLSAFELQAFFTYSRAEHELIQARRGNALKLGFALHIDFLRMSGPTARRRAGGAIRPMAAPGLRTLDRRPRDRLAARHVLACRPWMQPTGTTLGSCRPAAACW